MKFLYPGAVALALSSLAHGEAHPFVFAGPDVPPPVIVTEGDKSLLPIASELRDTISQSTGRQVSIQDHPKAGAAPVIRLSRNPKLADEKARALGEEGFLVSTEKENEVLIWGKGEAGISHGAHEFLERYLGVRWLFPGDLGVEVPEHASLVFPRERVLQEPVFFTRRLSPLFFNGASYAHGKKWSEQNRLGGELEFSHNLYNIFPPEKFAKTHPEFYPLVNGQRISPNPKTDARGYNWQPNFSAPGLVDTAASHILKYFAAKPEAASFPLGINDAHEFDESPASRQRRSGRINALGLEDVSDDYFLWANEVVEKVNEKAPGKLFGVLAYTHVADPPTKTSVHAQIVPFLTSDRMMWSRPKLRKEDQERTLGWAKAAPTLGWYDYTYGSWYRLPRIYPRLMQEYLAWAAGHNVRHYYSELYPNWSGEGPKAWILAKLLWNPFQDADRLLEDWCRNAVGEQGGPSLAAYFRLWERFWVEKAGKSPWMKEGTTYCNFADPGYLSLVSSDHMKEAEELLKKVIAAPKTAKQAARTGKIMAMWDYYRLGIESWQAEQEGKRALPASAEEVLKNVERAEIALSASFRRQALMASFTPEEWQPGRFFFNSRWARPDDINWGSSLLWSALPWIKEEPQVRNKIEQLAANGPDGAREHARILLAVSRDEGAPLLRNDIFRRNTAPWRVIHRVQGQGDALPIKGEEAGGLLFNGAVHATFVQSVPWEAGLYYAKVRFAVPPGRKAPDSCQISLIPSNGFKGEKDHRLLLPTIDVSWPVAPAQPGEEREILLPLLIPPIEDATRQLSVVLRAISRNPESQIIIRQLQLYKIPDAAAPPAGAQAGEAAQKEPVSRKVLIEPKPEALAVFSVQTVYPEPEGERLLQYYGELVASDTMGRLYQRVSDDNGKTWTEPQEIFQPLKEGEGAYRRGEEACLPDYERGLLLRFYNWSLYPEKGHAASVMMQTRIFCEISRDGGRSFEPAQQLIVDGGTPKNWAPDVEYGRNSVMISFSAPFLNRAGEIILPAQFIREVPPGTSAYRIPLEAVCLVGSWTSSGTLQWHMSEPVSVTPNLSSRGLCEPAIAELNDGRLLMIARGSNARLPGVPARKWKSISTDGGRHWSRAEPFGFSKGDLFFSPSAGSSLIRSGRTGLLYWIGNITPENASGNLPRYPLVMAQVNEKDLTLMKETIREVDTRRAGEPAEIQLSNFRVYEDRQSGEFVLTMARLSDGKRGGSPAWEYRILP